MSLPASPLLRKVAAALLVVATLLLLGRATPAATAAPAPIALKLPWDQGNTNVYLTSGPHGGAIQYRCNEPLRRPLSQLSGLDFGMPWGTEVLAAAGGWVRYAQTDPSALGKTVALEHGSGFFTQYWHLSSIDPAIKLNDWVPQGRVLGRSGNAGSGDHLHLEFGTRFRSGNTPWSADGLTIDGYTAHAIVRTSDGQAYNYQGTLTRGAAHTEAITWCAGTANSGAATRWLGTNEPGYPTGTVYAQEGGGGGRLRSTNQRITGNGGGGNGANPPANCPGQYKAEYFTNTTNPTGTPTLTRCENGPIAHNWGGNSPDGRISADRFAARWSTRAVIDAGRQRFRLRADDGVRVYLDGTLLPELNQWRDQDGSREYTYERDFPTRAEHDIRVEYFESYGAAHISFSWERVTQTPWSVSLSASATSIQPSQSVTLTATASQDVGPTPYYLRIVQPNMGDRQLRTCDSGRTCTVTLSGLAAGSTLVVRARVDNGSGGNLQAESAPITVTVGQNSGGGTSCTPGRSVDQGFLNEVLGQLGISATASAQQAMAAWQQAENTNACWNPLATTWGKPGATNFNSIGVKNYASRADGVSATALTLSTSNSYNYDDIRGFLALQSFNRGGIEQELRAYSGNGAYVTGILNQWQSIWNARPGASGGNSNGGSRAEVIVDDRSGGFQRGGQYWWEASIGYSSHMYWTYVNGSATSSWGEWSAQLGGGRYEVFVFVPRDHATSQRATYSVYHAGGVSNRTVNQNDHYDAWVSLGVYDFAAGGGRRVRLTDATGEAASTRRRLGFDAVKFTPR